MDKTNSGVDADQQQHHSKSDARITGQTLCPFADGDAPIDQKQPDAICEVPNRRGNTDHVDDKDRNHAKLTSNDLECLVRMSGDRLIVESRNHAKPEVEHVKKNEEEQDHTGDALDQIEP